MKFPAIVVGLEHRIERTVEPRHAYETTPDGAHNDILSTGALAEWISVASGELVDARLPDGFMTVGKATSIVHEHLCIVGAQLSVKAVVSGFDGYHVELVVTAEDGDDLVATATHTRTIVNERWFRLKVARKISDQLP